MQIILDSPVLKTNWGSGAWKYFNLEPILVSKLPLLSLKKILFSYDISVIFNGNCITTIILYYQMLVIMSLIKSLSSFKKEFYHTTFSTWSVLNNIIWKILGSSFISNFPLRAWGHFDLCWNQHVFEFGKRKKGMVQLFKKLCLYLSVLGLCCWVWASCGEGASHCSGFSSCGEGLLTPGL